MCVCGRHWWVLNTALWCAGRFGLTDCQTALRRARQGWWFPVGSTSGARGAPWSHQSRGTVKALGLWADLSIPGVQRLRCCFMGLHQCVPGYVCTAIPQEAKRKLSDSEGCCKAEQRQRLCRDQNQLERQSWKPLWFFFPFSVSFLCCSRTTLDLCLGIFSLLGKWHHCYIGWLLCWG